MKRRGCSWTVPGARAMAKVRELVTNSTLAPWCLRPRPADPPHPRATGGVPQRLPWPLAPCPAAHGPARDPAVAHLQRVIAGRYRH